MEISTGAALAVMANTALQRQQFSINVLKQQAQAVTEVMTAATQTAGAIAAGDGRGSLVDVSA